MSYYHFDFKGEKFTHELRKLLAKDFVTQSALIDAKKCAIVILGSGVHKNGARLHFLIIGGESWDIRGLQAGTAPPSTPLSSQAFAKV